MKILNLTAHNVNILDSEDNIVQSFIPAGHVARVQQVHKEYGSVEYAGGVLNVVKPHPVLNFDGLVIKPYHIYIVSWIFLQALRDCDHPHLHQFIAPKTGGLGKDEKGAVRGVYEFVTIS